MSTLALQKGKHLPLTGRAFGHYLFIIFIFFQWCFPNLPNHRIPLVYFLKIYFRGPIHSSTESESPGKCYPGYNPFSQEQGSGGARGLRLTFQRPYVLEQVSSGN